jgi:type II secretory pathway component GspD/PulD (secretin)
MIISVRSLIFSLFILVISPILLAGALAGEEPPPPPPPVAANDLVGLPLKADFTLNLTELLTFASKTLDITILFDAHVTDDIIYQFTGPVKVAAEKFQGFFERLLLQKQFIFAGTGDDQAAIYAVLDTTQSRGMSMIQAASHAAETITMADLPAYADRGILINIAVPLKHIHARETMTSLNTYFQNQVIERVRPVDLGNALIITAPAVKVCRIVELIHQMDRPPVEPAKTVQDRIQGLEKKVEALEKEIAALKKAE